MMDNSILNWIKEMATGKKSRVFWAIILLLLILVLVIFPYIDANFIYYYRTKQRIEILTKMTELDTDIINQKTELKNEYNYLLDEIDSTRNRIIKSPLENKDKDFGYWIKFIGGAFLLWLVSLISLFKKNKSSSGKFRAFMKNNFLIFIVCVLVGGVLGYVFAFIPTLKSFWINAVLSPIIQLLIIGLFMGKERIGTKSKSI